MNTTMKEMLMEEAQDDRTRDLLPRTTQVNDEWIAELLAENARLRRGNQRLENQRPTLPTTETMPMSQQPVDGAGWIYVRVRADQVGRVIGKKRQNLNRVEQRYNVLVDVSESGLQANNSQISPSAQVPVKISGSQQDCYAAGRDITDKLQNTLRVPLPDWLMPMMTEGKAFRSLTTKYGVRIEVSNDCPMMGTSDAGELLIHGMGSNCRAAQDEVLAFIQKHRPAM